MQSSFLSLEVFIEWMLLNFIPWIAFSVRHKHFFMKFPLCLLSPGISALTIHLISLFLTIINEKNLPNGVKSIRLG